MVLVTTLLPLFISLALALASFSKTLITEKRLLKTCREHHIKIQEDLLNIRQVIMAMNSEIDALHRTEDVLKASLALALLTLQLELIEPISNAIKVVQNIQKGLKKAQDFHLQRAKLLENAFSIKLNFSLKKIYFKEINLGESSTRDWIDVRSKSAKLRLMSYETTYEAPLYKDDPRFDFYMESRSRWRWSLRSFIPRWISKFADEISVSKQECGAKPRKESEQWKAYLNEDKFSSKFSVWSQY